MRDDEKQSIAFTLYGLGMVRSGVKRETRHIVTPQPKEGDLVKLLVKKGDLLWIAEPFRLPINCDDRTPNAITKTGIYFGQIPTCYEVDQSVRNWENHIIAGRLRRANTMPIWASRSLIRIDHVCHQRLRDITFAGLQRTGVTIFKALARDSSEKPYRVMYRYDCQGGRSYTGRSQHEAYFKAWDYRHKGKERSGGDPWVTAITFTFHGVPIGKFKADA